MKRNIFIILLILLLILLDQGSKLYIDSHYERSSTEEHATQHDIEAMEPSRVLLHIHPVLHAKMKAKFTPIAEKLSVDVQVLLVLNSIFMLSIGILGYLGSMRLYQKQFKKYTRKDFPILSACAFSFSLIFSFLGSDFTLPFFFAVLFIAIYVSSLL